VARRLSANRRGNGGRRPIAEESYGRAGGQTEGTRCGMKIDKTKTVDRTGAVAGAVLRGISSNNRGLRLRVLCEQARGEGGPVVGGVVLLDPGDNKHTGVLEGLLCGHGRS